MSPALQADSLPSEPPGKPVMLECFLVDKPTPALHTCLHTYTFLLVSMLPSESSSQDLSQAGPWHLVGNWSWRRLGGPGSFPFLTYISEKLSENLRGRQTVMLISVQIALLCFPSALLISCLLPMALGSSSLRCPMQVPSLCPQVPSAYFSPFPWQKCTCPGKCS